MELSNENYFGLIVIALGVLLLMDITQNFKELNMKDRNYKLYLVVLASLLIGIYLVLN